MATQKQIAEHLDLSPKRVSELYRDSILTSNSMDATRVQYICYLRKLSGYNKKTGTGDMQEEKTRLTKAQADAAELKVSELEGLLLPVQMVLNNWSNVMSIVRVGLLGLAPKVAHRLMAAKSVQEMKVIIDEVVYMILNELAESNGIPKEYAERVDKHNADIETTTQINN